MFSSAAIFGRTSPRTLLKSREGMECYGSSVSGTVDSVNFFFWNDTPRKNLSTAGIPHDWKVCLIRRLAVTGAWNELLRASAAAEYCWPRIVMSGELESPWSRGANSQSKPCDSGQWQCVEQRFAPLEDGWCGASIWRILTRRSWLINWWVL